MGRRWSATGSTESTGNIIGTQFFAIGLQADPFTLTRQALTRKFVYRLDSLNGEVLFDGTLLLQDLHLGWADGVSIINGVVDPSENHVQITMNGTIKIYGGLVKIWIYRQLHGLK